MEKSIEKVRLIKTLISMIIGIFVIGMCTVYAQSELLDINNHWSKQYVQYLVNKGAINGYTDGTFKPDNTVTYGEAIKLIVTSYEKNIQNGVEHWATTYIEYAKEKGIIPDSMKIDSKIDEKISRKEVIYLVRESLTQLASKPIIQNDRYEMTKAFEDVSVLINTNGIKYSQAIKDCYNLGIVVGNENGLFNPDNEITRAEMVTILARAFSEEYRIYPMISVQNELPSNAQEYRMILAYMPNSFYEAGNSTFAKYNKGATPYDYLNYYKDITSVALNISRQKADTIMNAMLNVSYDMLENEWIMWKEKVLLFEGITSEQVDMYIQYVKDNKISIRGGTILNPCTIGEMYISKNKSSLGIKGIIDYEILSNPNNVKYITFSEFVTKIKGTIDVTSPQYIVMYISEDELQTNPVKVLHYLKYSVNGVNIY